MRWMRWMRLEVPKPDRTRGPNLLLTGGSPSKGKNRRTEGLRPAPDLAEVDCESASGCCSTAAAAPALAPAGQSQCACAAYIVAFLVLFLARSRLQVHGLLPLLVPSLSIILQVLCANGHHLS